MKPDLSRSDFDALQQQSERLTRSTRVLYGLEPREDVPSTPFDWLSDLAVRAFEIFAIAAVLVLVVALMFSRGGPTP